MVELRVHQDGTSHVRAYSDEIISIGKAPSNLLVLTHEEVSRKHALFDHEGERSDPVLRVPAELGEEVFGFARDVKRDVP